MTEKESEKVNEERIQRVCEHNAVYFKRLRDFLVKETAVAAKLPDFYKLTYTFLVFECADGYAIAGYPGGVVDNYVATDTRRSLDELLKSLPNPIQGTDQHATVSAANLSGTGAFHIIMDKDIDTTHGPRPTLGWKFLSAGTPGYGWPREDAEKRAEEAIAGFRGL